MADKPCCVSIVGKRSHGRGHHHAVDRGCSLLHRHVHRACRIRGLCRWGRRMTRGKPTITPEMESEILNGWQDGWPINTIRNHLRLKFGNWMSDQLIYSAVYRARRRGDKRAVRRHTDMVVSSS
jgi:hypothetical protein